MPRRTVTTRQSRKAERTRKFGTDRPLPRSRILPGTNERGSEEAIGSAVLVGAKNHDKRTRRPQLDLTNPNKRRQANYEGDAKGACERPLTSQVDFLVMPISRHKRQLDTIELDSQPHKMVRVSLNPNSKLGERFPHLVKKVSLAETAANTESNKRRRTLPFRTKGSGSSQCADHGGAS